MKILTKYIIREHIPPFLFSLAVLMFLFLMNFLVKYITQIFGKGLSVWTIFELIFYNLAWMFALAVPMSVLIATLMSFGRFSADNEIIILKSSGISIYRLIRPALIFASVITILMILFNDMVLPDFNHRARVMFHNIREKKPTLKLEPGIFFTVGKYSFLVEKIDKTLGEELSERTNMLGPDYDNQETPDRLLNVTIFDRSQQEKTITVTAKEGYMVYSQPKKALIFTLFDGEYHVFDLLDEENYRFSHFDRNVVTIDAPEFQLDEKDDDYRGDREMNVEMMMKKVDESREQLRNESSKIINVIERDWKAATSRIDTLVKVEPVADTEEDITLLEGISAREWIRACDRAFNRTQRSYQLLRTARSRIKTYKQSINRYLVEVHKKFSIPFSSIVFILIGAPLGIFARKGSLGVGATLSIFFFLIYWIGLILGEDLADRRLLTPFMAMWLPNILIGLAGSYLTWRAVKETMFIRWDRIVAVFNSRRKKPERDKPVQVSHTDGV